MREHLLEIIRNCRLSNGWARYETVSRALGDRRSYEGLAKREILIPILFNLVVDGTLEETVKPGRREGKYNNYLRIKGE
jgi:hypothetical protein